MVSGSCIYPVYGYQELIPLHNLFMGIRREASFVWGAMGSREAAGNFGFFGARALGNDGK